MEKQEENTEKKEEVTETAKKFVKIDTFRQYMLMKAVVIISAASVSIFSAQFWQIWLFL